MIELFDTHVQIKRKTLREVISIDEFYFSRCFKHVTVCIDSFHVMKDMNDELDRLRKSVMESYKIKKSFEEYHLLKHHNIVLFKEDLDKEYHYSKFFHQPMNEIDYLNRILKIDPDLTKAYEEIKRYYYFNHYWYEYTPSEALDYLNGLINEWYLSDNKCLIKLAGTLDNWKQYIANSFIPYVKHDGEVIRLSNGKIEGKNSYIKKMLKLANGYSNFERFRNRAMYSENYYETYSEEKLKNTVKRIFTKKKDQRE